MSGIRATGAVRTSDTLGEARDLAAALARDLARAEAGLDVNAVFRTAHSLKGVAGLLGAGAAQGVAHAIEDVLDEIRLGRARLGPALRAAMLDAADRCGELLESRDAAAASPVAARLHELLREAAVEHDEDPLALVELPTVVREALTEYELARLRENVRLGRAIHRATVGFSLETFERGLEACQAAIARHGELVATLPATSDAELSFELLLASVLAAPAVQAQLGPGCLRVEPVARVQRSAPPGSDESPGDPARRVRVPLAAIRAVESALAALGPDPRLGDLRAAVRALGHLPARDLAVRVEETLLSVAAAWGRDVRLEVAGHDVEIGVGVAEALAEPLLHLVRNALDHGVETPGERVRQGKPPGGVLHLDFFDREGWVELRLSDDGAGIDADRVAAVALARGIADARALAAMSSEDRLQLVFTPGVSTAAQGGHSGRGVGLDVVRAAVRRLGGTVRVESVRGEGTTFVLRLPRG